MSITFETSGFDEFEQKINKMRQAAQDLNGTHDVPFNELFTSSFMRTYTPNSSFDDFLKAGGFNPSTQEEFNAIPEKDLNDYVSANTKFKSFQEMYKTAVAQYIGKKLGF